MRGTTSGGPEIDEVVDAVQRSRSMNAPRIALPVGGLLGARLSRNGAGPLLSLRGLSKSFGGAVGVRDVSLDVARA